MNGFENYQISNYGRVKSKTRISKVGIKNVKEIIRAERILKPNKLTKGYLGVTIYNKTRVKTFRIHRLVAAHFIPNPQNLPQVNHIDGNKENNFIENLEWCSNFDNMQHAINNNLINQELRKENMREVGKTGKGAETRWRKYQ